MLIHKFTAEEARVCVMHDETMRIRRESKIMRRVGNEFSLFSVRCLVLSVY
jgi:hypothetical protein